MLLLEGGTEARRLEMGLYWAMTGNCPAAIARMEVGKPAVPCGSCAVCSQIKAGEHTNVWRFDGRISNREDEEKPGLTRALRIENVRALKAAVNTRPNGNGTRFAIIQGMSQTREEALNSLLKTLEEPGPFTRFALLTPQREQILPTLVSRSFCLTLPWSGSLDQPETAGAWEERLAGFIANGKGFLEQAAAKGGMDAIAAGEILLACQRSLVRVIAGRSAKNPLDGVLAPLAKKHAGAATFGRWLIEAQKMLQYGVNPARVLEAFATRALVLIKGLE